ncbi:hypothetical protein [Psychromonas aquimarina]|uniref:hypothetical protein n=1 Tax=Psychromonas aquimarina TaxID=444919 RepID=UPI0004906085|nr:hypothetical protein [Psychromonas aquimarina]
MDKEIKSKLLKLINYADELGLQIIGAATPCNNTGSKGYVLFDSDNMAGQSETQCEPLRNISLLIKNNGDLNKFLLEKAKIEPDNSDTINNEFSKYPCISKAYH